MSANIFPEPWVLNLTKDETDLFHNLTPDYASGAFKSEFRVRVELMPDNLSVDELTEELLAAKRNGCDEIFSSESDTGCYILVLEGSVPLTEDEREVYDSIMAKMRDWRRQVLEEAVSEAEARAAALRADLENYVW